MTLFDINGNSYPDKEEPRMYDTGDGPEVECASCHDPHYAGHDSLLKVDNTDSALCLTCHDK